MSISFLTWSSKNRDRVFRAALLVEDQDSSGHLSLPSSLLNGRSAFRAFQATFAVVGCFRLAAITTGKDFKVLNGIDVTDHGSGCDEIRPFGVLSESRSPLASISFLTWSSKNRDRVFRAALLVVDQDSSGHLSVPSSLLNGRSAFRAFQATFAVVGCFRLAAITTGKDFKVLNSIDVTDHGSGCDEIRPFGVLSESRSPLASISFLTWLSKNRDRVFRAALLVVDQDSSGHLSVPSSLLNGRSAFRAFQAAFAVVDCFRLAAITTGKDFKVLNGISMSPTTVRAAMKSDPSGSSRNQEARWRRSAF